MVTLKRTHTCLHPELLLMEKD
jgi:hypothetical protein